MNVSRRRAPDLIPARSPAATAGATGADATPAAGWAIVRVHEPGEPEREVVVQPSAEVGRSPGGIVLADPAVSWRHLTLLASSIGLVVHDLDSHNGTLVNGVRIDQPTLVDTGDEVALGTSTIRVVSVGAPATVGLERSQLDWLEADLAIVESRSHVPLIVVPEPEPLRDAPPVTSAGSVGDA